MSASTYRQTANTVDYNLAFRIECLPPFPLEELFVNTSDGNSQDAQSWKRLYRAAVLETNMELGPRRVLEARKAAGERAMRLIREAADDDPELLDLAYASRVLDRIEQQMSVRETFETQAINSGGSGIRGKNKHLCVKAGASDPRRLVKEEFKIYT
jgi:hypothetical protein